MSHEGTIAGSDVSLTEYTWNPVTGCSKISPGCDYCYAETIVQRLQMAGIKGYSMGFDVTTHRDRLSQPLTREQPTCYFVGTLGDLFHPEVPDEFIDDILNVMGQAPHHVFHVLTRRSDRLPGFFANRSCPVNFRLGVSIEDRAHLGRLEHLQQVKAAVRFVYFEPLLESLGEFSLSGIDWVVIGGEAGFGARPMNRRWAREIATKAELAGIPVNIKETEAAGDVQSRGEDGRAFRGRTWNRYFDVPPVKR